MIEFPNKSPEVYLKVVGPPLLSLDVYYVDVDEANVSLLSVVPQVLGRCAPRFSFPLSFSPLLPLLIAGYIGAMEQPL